MPTIIKYQYDIRSSAKNQMTFAGRLDADTRGELDRKVERAACCRHDWMELEIKCAKCGLEAKPTRRSFLPEFGFL